MVDEQTGKRRANKKFATGTAAGVVTGGLIMVAALNLVPPRTVVTAVPSSTTPTAATTTATTTPPVAAPSASETPTPTPTPTPTIAGPTAAPTTTTTTSKPAGEVLTSLPRLSYVAVFKWLPKSSYSAADAAAYAAENQRGGQRVVAIDGNLIQKAGNWGIGVANLDDFAEATATCKAMGFGTTGQDCFRRAVL